jgi:hypothetical protein
MLQHGAAGDAEHLLRQGDDHPRSILTGGAVHQHGHVTVIGEGADRRNQRRGERIQRLSR